MTAICKVNNHITRKDKSKPCYLVVILFQMSSYNQWPSLGPEMTLSGAGSGVTLCRHASRGGALELSLVGWLVGFVALRPKSTAMVIAGRSVHLTTLFPGQA